MRIRKLFPGIIGGTGLALLVSVSLLSPPGELSGPMERVATGILGSLPGTPWILWSMLLVVGAWVAVFSFRYRGNLVPLEQGIGLTTLFLCGPLPAAWLLVLSGAARVMAEGEHKDGERLLKHAGTAGVHAFQALGAALVYFAVGGSIPLAGLETRAGWGDPTAAGWGPVAAAMLTWFLLRELLQVGSRLVEEGDFHLLRTREGLQALFAGRTGELALNGGMGLALALSLRQQGILPAALRMGLILFACRMVRDMVENREDLKRRIQEMRSLSMVGRAICSSMQPEDLMAVIYRECRRLLEPSLFYVGLHDDQRKSLRVELLAEGDEVLEGTELPLTKGFAALAFRTRNPVVFHRRRDMEEHPSYAADGYLEGPRCESYLWVPIATRDRVYGVISARHRAAHRFSPSTVHAVQAIAQQSAVALENIKLFRKATQDSLTGLYLRSYFEQKLEEQMFKARRHGFRMSLMVIDLDNFKDINDTLGHAAGDEVLREVGKAIGHSIRAQDVAARYGGDEFVLMLPGISVEVCLDVAARIKGQVQALNFPVLARMGTSRITVSIGIATVAPGEQTDLQSLFDTADKALYEAKRSGKNKVLARTGEAG